MSEEKRSESRPAMGPGRGPGHMGRVEKVKDARTALRRLAEYLKPHTASLVFVFVLVIVYTALGLVGPLSYGRSH